MARFRLSSIGCKGSLPLIFLVQYVRIGNGEQEMGFIGAGTQQTVPISAPRQEYHRQQSRTSSSHVPGSGTCCPGGVNNQLDVRWLVNKIKDESVAEIESINVLQIVLYGSRNP